MMGRGFQVENFDKIVPDPYRHNTFGNLVELKSEAGRPKSGSEGWEADRDSAGSLMCEFTL